MNQTEILWRRISLASYEDFMQYELFGQTELDYINSIINQQIAKSRIPKTHRAKIGLDALCKFVEVFNQGISEKFMVHTIITAANDAIGKYKRSRSRRGKNWRNETLISMDTFKETLMVSVDHDGIQTQNFVSPVQLRDFRNKTLNANRVRKYRNETH